MEQFYNRNSTCQINGAKKINFSFTFFCIILCALIFINDNILFFVPNFIFVIILAVVMLFCKKEDFYAVSVCLPLFTNAIQIVLVMLIGFPIYILKFKPKINMILFLPVLLSLVELSHVILQPFSFVDYARHVITYFSLFLLLSDLGTLSKEEIQGIIKKYIFTYIFVMVDILVQFINKYGSIMFFITHSVRFGYASRESGMEFGKLFNNENMIGLYSLISAGASFFLLFTHKNKILFLMTLLVSCVFGFLTGSRTFVISLILLGFIAFWILLSTKKITQRKKIVILVSSIVVFVAACVALYSTVLKNVIDRFLDSNSDGNRISIFTDYTNYMIDNPEYTFFGIGIQSVTDKTGLLDPPHNAVQELFVSMGVAGIILITIMYIYLFIESRNCRKDCLRGINLLILLPFLLTIQLIQYVRLPEVFYVTIIASLPLFFSGEKRETEEICE